jgi:hypothetical protein
MRVHGLLIACVVGLLLAVPTPLDVFHEEPVIFHAEEASCAAPAMEVAPQPGGQRQVRIQSPCRRGELVVGRYGEIVIMERLDQSGNLAFQLDCFLGDRELTLTFVDNRRAANHACASPERTLTKVAIVWQDHVNLDLHAFEYAALPGSAYDRSPRNPGSYQAAQAEFVQSRRSHGFISTVSDGQRMGHNIEVYTLLRHPAELPGLIALAVGLGNGEAANAEACGNGPRTPLRVDIDVYVLDPGMKPRSYERTFAAAPCDGAWPRFVTNLVPNILLGTGGATNAP